MSSERPTTIEDEELDWTFKIPVSLDVVRQFAYFIFHQLLFELDLAVGNTCLFFLLFGGVAIFIEVVQVVVIYSLENCLLLHEFTHSIQRVPRLLVQRRDAQNQCAFFAFRHFNLHFFFVDENGDGSIKVSFHLLDNFQIGLLKE